jgi:hypothetical protein
MVLAALTALLAATLIAPDAIATTDPFALLDTGEVLIAPKKCTVIISDDATNPSLNFGALQEQVDEVIESSSFFNKATSSGSAQLLVPITALASCIAMFL